MEGNHVNGSGADYDKYLRDLVECKVCCHFCDKKKPESTVRFMKSTKERICEVCVANLSIDKLRLIYPDSTPAEIREIIEELFPETKKQKL